MKEKRDVTEKIYILRKEHSCKDYHEMTSDTEYIFSSYEEAVRFIEKLAKDDDAQRMFGKRIELVEIFVDEDEPWERDDWGRYWIFDHQGELLEDYATYEEEDGPGDIFTGKFKVGDIVFFYPSHSEIKYASADGEYGVVVQVPPSLDEWVARGEDPSHWENNYVVYFISTHRRIVHLHLAEVQITKYDEALPDEFKFLEVYARHLKGHIRIPDEIDKDRNLYEVVVRNTKTICVVENEGSVSVKKVSEL